MATSSGAGSADLPQVTVWALKLASERIDFACILHVLAIIMTGFRATYRWRRRNFSWDDGWAIVAAGFNCVLLAFLWVRSGQVDVLAAGHVVNLRQMRITYLWGSLAFTCAVWAARVSIACSILRFIPRNSLRTMLLFSVGLFFLTWVTLLVAKTSICTPRVSADDCYLGKPYMVCKLVTDVVADGLLVAIPLYLLWHSHLAKIPKRIIRIVFTTTTINSTISILHICFQFQNTSFLEEATALFEAAISAMVCNLLVIVTFCYRITRNGAATDESMSTTTFNSRFASRDPSQLEISLTEITNSSPSHVHPFSGGFTSLFSSTSRLRMSNMIETMQFKTVSSQSSGEASKATHSAKVPALETPV